MKFHDFPWPVIFHDFPGLENSFLKFHDFLGYVGTLRLTSTHSHMHASTHTSVDYITSWRWCLCIVSTLADWCSIRVWSHNYCEKTPNTCQISQTVSFSVTLANSSKVSREILLCWLAAEKRCSNFVRRRNANKHLANTQAFNVFQCHPQLISGNFCTGYD